MPKHIKLLLSLAGSFLMLAPQLPSKEEIASSEALISRARQLQDIWSDGTLPIQMRAEIQVLGPKGDPVIGSYSFVRLSPSRWREEIRFEGYERIRVGDSKGYWQKSRLGYQPESVFQLDTLLHVGGTLKVASNQTLGAIKSHEKNGLRQKCTEVKWPWGTDRVLCFDEDKGSLVRIDYPTVGFQIAPEISRIEYSAFNVLGEKLVPYEVRALRGKKVIAAIKVLEISLVPKEDASVFTLPENAEFWAHCDAMQEATLVSHVHPNYPASARHNHQQGRVIFYGIIEPNGSLSHLTLLQHTTPALDAAALEAVRRWRYNPAVCGQSPIRMETSISLDFWLQP